MFLTLTLGFLAAAGEPKPLHVQMDALVTAGQGPQAKLAAGRSSDEEFLRRVTLDLDGTLPTVDDVRKFLDDKAVNKREKAIDRLLASPNYARRMMQHYDVVFMERRRDVKVTRAEWEKYLQTAFETNRPYNELVREILSADGVDPKLRPAAKFFLDRELEPHLVTRDLGRVFLGRNLQCAQCHDHPHVEQIKQSEYYGIYAYVNRSYLHPNAKDAKAVIAEKAEGDVTFVSVFDKAMKQGMTNPVLPGIKAMMEPKLEKGKEYISVPSATVRGIPKYSRRSLLPEAIATPENKAFVRTSVNRLWALMLGRGIVNPLDADHELNPASHPELLDLLCKEFVSHKFDIKWMLKQIAMSETYQRSSVVPKSLAALEVIPEDRYLVAQLKPLTPEQMAHAIGEATLRPANVGAFRNVFGGQPGEPDDGKSTSLDQTLFFKHGAVIREGFTATKPGNLADKLSKLKDEQIPEELFLAVLSRKPTADEAKDILAILKDSKTKPALCGELVWALIASGEFRFNH